MYMFALLSMAVGLIIYGVLTQTNSQSFLFIVVIGVVCISMGSAAIPQMLTLARQWSNTVEGVDITQFNTRLRAAISIAWIAGPAIGFSIVAYTSFTVAFYIAATCGVVAVIFAYRYVPKVKQVKQDSYKEGKQRASISFWLLVAVITLVSGANVLYSSALPLYTIEEFNFSPSLPGLFIATVALLEIPIILYSSRLARQFSKVKLMAVSLVCAMIFYIGIYFSEEVWQFFALQIINAIAYGLLAGLSLTFLQEQLPKRVGFTSALCSNAFKFGMMLGSITMGLIAQFSSFRYANLGAFVIALLSLLCLLLYSYFKKKEQAKVM